MRYHIKSVGNGQSFSTGRNQKKTRFGGIIYYGDDYASFWRAFHLIDKSINDNKTAPAHRSIISPRNNSCARSRRSPVRASASESPGDSEGDDGGESDQGDPPARALTPTVLPPLLVPPFDIHVKTERLLLPRKPSPCLCCLEGGRQS